MKTNKVIRVRDGGEVRWGFEWVAGLEAFGRRDERTGRVVVDGVYAGQVACDWLRDQGIEPVVM